MSASGRTPAVWHAFVPLLIFGVCLAAGSVLLTLPWVGEHLLAPWTRVNATAAVGLVRLLGGRASIAGTVISFDVASTDILNGCNGAHAVLILAAAFIASPIGLVARVGGLVFGSALIFGVNIARIAVLVLVGQWSPGLMEVFHVYVLQTFVILCAFAIYLLWMKRFAS